MMFTGIVEEIGSVEKIQRGRLRRLVRSRRSNTDRILLC